VRLLVPSPPEAVGFRGPPDRARSPEALGQNVVVDARQSVSYSFDGNRAHAAPDSSTLAIGTAYSTS
jgi:hypothetical protein